MLPPWPDAGSMDHWNVDTYHNTTQRHSQEDLDLQRSENCSGIRKQTDFLEC
jgi:hypothetical protein